jgi:hypothetical protein
MPTSGNPSSDPPNQAAIKPDLVSTIVDACADGKGALSKMKWLEIKPGCEAAPSMPVRPAARAAASQAVRKGAGDIGVRAPFGGKSLTGPFLPAQIIN